MWFCISSQPCSLAHAHFIKSGHLIFFWFFSSPQFTGLTREWPTTLLQISQNLLTQQVDQPCHHLNTTVEKFEKKLCYYSTLIT